MGALRPSTPGDFFSKRKSPKIRQGAPLDPLGGHCHPPSNASVAPPRKGRHHLQLKYLRGCRSPYTSATNTARAEGGGIQGGPPPCAGGPGTRRFLAYLSQHLCCYFPLREKVGRGAEHDKAMLMRSARSWGGAQRTGRQPLLASSSRSRGAQPHPLSPPADKNNLYILPLLCYFK